jgi:putative sigma-54 modulation protein
MNVEYTGRQCEVTPAIRKQVEHGLAKITRIFGENNFKTQVILTSEKYRQIAEITVMVRDKPIVGLAEGTEMLLVVGEALDHIERQAIKFKSRRRTKKRHPKKKKWPAPEQARKMQVSVGATATTAVPVVVHTYPALVRTTEAHVVPAQDAVAMRPLTLEEAIKECEFRDRDVFVFRDPQGRVKVLHRTKDGKMELIEAP